MPTVPLHPAVVHLPLGLAFVLPLLTVGLALALWLQLVPRRAWIVALALQATLRGAAGVLAIAAAVVLVPARAVAPRTADATPRHREKHHH